MNKNVLRSGFSLKEQGIGDYVGIIIDDSASDKLFLLDNFMVTHNSTSAAKLYGCLKDQKQSAELVREFVKDWAWEGRTIQRRHQLKIFSEQADKEGLLYGKLKYVVTDSPLILSEIYEERYFGAATMTQGLYERWLNLNKEEMEPLHFHLVRTKEYDPNGRYETEDQAKEMDVLIKSHVEGFCINNNQKLYIVDYETAAEQILDILRTL